MQYPPDSLFAKAADGKHIESQQFPSSRSLAAIAVMSMGGFALREGKIWLRLVAPLTWRQVIGSVNMFG
jgi:hypothetical protein